jgi:hypothetical protein
MLLFVTPMRKKRPPNAESFFSAENVTFYHGKVLEKLFLQQCAKSGTNQK